MAIRNLDIRDLLFATDKVDVSGSTAVGVTGPLTDAELRATPVPVIAEATGTLANGVETTVDDTLGGVEIVAADTTRKAVMIQNVGSSNIRVGVSGVTATTGIRLAPGEVLTLKRPYVPTAALFAIKEGLLNSTALTQQIT